MRGGPAVREATSKAADDVLDELERRASAGEICAWSGGPRSQRLEHPLEHDDVTFDEVRPDVDRAIEIFGEMGDNQGLARVWDFLAGCTSTPDDPRKR